MNKAEFSKQVDKLLARVETLHFSEHDKQIALFNDYKLLFEENAQYLNPHTTDQSYEIKNDFERAQQRNSIKNFDSAINSLRQEIRSLKHNSVPE